MQLTRYTDYSLRVLVYLSAKNSDWATIPELADFYAISRNHPLKVVHHLAQTGFINTRLSIRGAAKNASFLQKINRL